MHEPGFHLLTSKTLTSEQYENLKRAVETRMPSAIAHMNKERPSIVFALTEITSVMNSSAQALKKKDLNRSVLSNHSFDDVQNIGLEEVWQELKRHQPFILDCMLAISSKKTLTLHETDQDVQLELHLIYSVRMHQ